MWSAEVSPLSKIAARTLGKVRKSTRTDRGQDLRKEAPGERADVLTGDEEFEERLKKLLEKLHEEASFEVKVPFITVRTGIKTSARSPLSRASTAFLLTLAGCMCSAVLHAIGAPQWAQLAGLVLPWVIAVSQVPRKRRTGTRGQAA